MTQNKKQSLRKQSSIDQKKRERKNENKLEKEETKREREVM